MRSLKPWQVAVIVGVLATPVYLGAVANGWVLDDNLIVRRNDAAHSIEAAWRATLSPYWPVTEAGQYRPLVVWTYAVDWVLSGGDPAWFHTVNIVLHAVASALLAMVALRWLPALGAIITGVVFAWQPVHVEAVANVVGRAELITAIGLLGAILAARRFRAAVTTGSKWGWGLATLGWVLAALLSKEHGVVAIVLIAFDQALEPDTEWRTSVPLYVAGAAMTTAWLYVWWGVAGRLVPEVVAAPIAGLSWSDRLATMLPAQLDVFRLLTWPSNLAADYNPLVIPQRRELTALALVGLATSAATLTLATVVARRAPAITFGIVLAAVTYAPTSNLAFASGVPLAERNLYMAVAATALLAGWLVCLAPAGRNRLAALTVVGALAAVYAARSVARVPFWHDDQTAVIDEFVSHPENYRNHLRVATMLVDRGDTLSGVAQGMVAARLFPEDPWVAWRVVPWALAANWDRLARHEAERAIAVQPREAAFRRLLARTHLDAGHPDSAVQPARDAVLIAPNSTVVLRWYAEVLDSLQAAPWRIAITSGRLAWLDGQFARAGEMLDEAATHLAAAGTVRDCWDVEHARGLFERLRPHLLDAGAPRPRPNASCGLTGEDP